MQLKQIEKRNNEIVEYDKSKIYKAIEKAHTSTEIQNPKTNKDKTPNKITDIVDSVDFELIKYFGETKEIPNVELIQDIVEQTLMSSGLHNVARAYIIYRNQHKKLRDMSNSLKITAIDDYLTQNTYQNENANQQYSLQGLNHELSSSITKKFWLEEIYPPGIRNAHIDGDFHIHDLNLLASYCCGYSMEDIITKGFGGVKGKLQCSPPKHTSSLAGQTINFLFSLSGETAGALALSNVDTYFAPYIHLDKLSYEDLKQILQSWVFELNVSQRIGFQCPFTNITLDLKVPSDMKDKPALIAGNYHETLTYGDCQAEMDMFNRAFAEIMVEGDADGRLHSFPIPTYNIIKDLDWDNPVLDSVWRMTGKYGVPYFSNFINSDMNPEDARSMCPLHPMTKVEVKVNLDKDPIKTTIIDIYNSHPEKIYVKHKDQWIFAKIKKHENKGCVKMMLHDGESVIMGINHAQPCRVGKDTKDLTLRADELKVGMIVPTRDCFKKIVSIKNVCYDDDLYCFEVFSDTHLFELENGIITHNCRLRLDNRMLRKRGGGLFGSSPLTGSIGVVTINMARIGHITDTYEEFYADLENKMELAKSSLEIKRKLIERLTENDLYPYTKYYLNGIKERMGKYWGNHFSTIGLLGMNECCLNFLGEDIGSDVGRFFAEEVLDFMRDKLMEFQDDTSNLYNLEATPAEGSSYSIAKKDLNKFGMDINFGSGRPESKDDPVYYSNSSQLPVNYTDDMFEALDLQDELQCKYTGGTVLHVFMGEEIKDINTVKSIIKKIAYNYKMPYFSLTPTFSVCKVHKYLPGEQHICPICGKETEVFSRIVGYLRPIHQWHAAKNKEFTQRKLYKVDK